MKKLDAFENEIIEAYEAGALWSTMPSKSELRALREAARATSQGGQDDLGLDTR
jgi:hypothetical protein